MIQTNGSVTLEQKLDRAIKTLPNPSTVLKAKGALLDILHKVARQPDVFPQISSYKSSLNGLQPLITAKNKSLDTFFTAYVQQLGLRNIIQNAASARDYGIAVMEVTEYIEFEGKTVPAKLELCPPEYFTFDRERNLCLKTKEKPDGIDVFKTWPGKFILLQNNSTLTNPWGVGLLDVAYWIAVGLNGNFEFLMQFCEDDGRDKWIGKYPDGSTDTQIADLLNTLLNLRNNGVAAMPKGVDIEAKPMTGRSSSNDLYKNTDEMLRRKIEKLWTGTDLTMQVDGKGGYSSSANGLTIREDALQEGITLVEQAVTQLFKIVCYLNNLPEVPKVILQLPKSLNKTIAETDQIYFNMGLKPTKELFIKRGYSEEDFTVEDKTVKPTADFSDFSEEISPLLDSFEAYAERLKKKDGL
ncbi:MAG: DUF935 family protein [Bacteroidales bacterium]